LIFRATDYSFLLVNSEDTVWSQKTTSIQLNFEFSENEISPKDEWKWSQYVMDNNRTNPFGIWNKNKCPDFPSKQLFEEIRDQEV
jgi:hypothetical protein